MEQGDEEQDAGNRAEGGNRQLSRQASALILLQKCVTESQQRKEQRPRQQVTAPNDS